MILNATGLNFFYGNKQILHNICQEFHQGKLTVIAGPNGSGKSTLLKCLIHLLTPSTGEILLRGRPLSSMKRGVIAQRISYVPQKIESYFDFTVEEIIRMGRYPFRNSKEAVCENTLFQETTLLTETDTLLHRKLSTLSGGESQRVILARALIQTPEILVLDEPSSNLDISHNIKIMKLIKKHISEKNIAVIAVLHDLNDIMTYADTLVLLKEGKIHSQGSPLEILTKESLKEVFEIESRIITDPDTGKPLILPRY